MGPTVDLAGAARATGLSLKAVRRRVERGSLPAVMVDGRRRIPVRALLDAGLLVSDASAGGRAQTPRGDRGLAEAVARQGQEIERLWEAVRRLERELSRERSAR